MMKRFIFFPAALLAVPFFLLNSPALAGLNEDLIQAAIGGTVEEVSRLLSQGADVKAKNKDGDTPGILAWKQGHSEVAQLLQGTVGPLPEEALARQAEEAGKLREALAHYVNALQSVAAGSSKDRELREKIIKLFQRIQPPPAVGEEARRLAIRGRVAIQEAKSPSDFADAAREFGKALRLAPWWAESYYNQAIALEKAGQFDQAIQSLKWYLLAAPGAPDAEKVRDQIYALEYRQERAKKETREKAEQESRQLEEAKRQVEEAKRRDAATLASLSGRWKQRGGYFVGKGYDYTIYQLTIVGNDQFELVPLGILDWDGDWIPHDDGKNSWLSYFVGRLSGGQLTGRAFGDAGTDRLGCPRPQGSFTGEVLAQGRGLRLSIVWNWRCEIAEVDRRDIVKRKVKVPPDPKPVEYNLERY